MKLNLGCGGDVREGFVNVDLRKHSPRVDVAHDLNDLPWPWADESCELIVAKAVLEHLRITLIDSLNECWRILHPGGRLWLKIPYWKHGNSYLDPTHYWQFDLHTPDIFDPDTEYGHRYGFYTDRKWRIVRGPKLNRAQSSIIATLEVRK
jgi:SAM-dependent methyltransferase